MHAKIGAVFAGLAGCLVVSALVGQEPAVPGGLDAVSKVYDKGSRPAVVAARGAGEWYRNWEMEQRVGQSQLVLVVRVSNVSALTVVHGAKVNTTYREYRFQPVRRLKGVFTRDELPMSSSDLGLTESDGSQAPPIQQGELRLLLLTRTPQGGLACTGYQPGMSMNLDQLIPKLTGADDPIVTMAGALVRVTESPSRKERTELLLRQLDESAGPATVPLLKSLGARAVWAAQMPAAAGPLARLAESESPSIRTAAVQTLGRVLAAGSLGDDSKALGECADALKRLLDADDVETEARAAALTAIGHLGDYARRQPWTTRVLAEHVDQPRTHAEFYAATAALAELNDVASSARVLAALERLPLDELATREQTLVTAAVRLAGDKVAPALLRRLEQKLIGEHYAPVEIAYLGQLKHRAATPALLRAAAVSSPYRQGNEAGANTAVLPGLTAYSGWDAFHQQQFAVVYAFEQLREPRAVPVLGVWLSGSNTNQYLRSRALDALAAIDNDEAVAAVRLRFKAEPDLGLKMRMAAMLGRHGIADGYALAIEHVADPGLTPQAAAALGAIRDPRTRDELWRILDTSHDRQWNAAALHGLVAVGDERVKDRLLEILGDVRHPLLAEAVVAAGTLGDTDSLPLIAMLVGSRNQQVAQASLRAVARLATRERIGDDAARRAALRDAVTAVLALLGDPDADQNLRLAALNTARQLADDRIRPAFRALADRAELEGSQILPRLELELNRTDANEPPRDAPDQSE
jgi:HEAT repeat protein